MALSYNERGHSKGIATVVFKSSANANTAVEKYNGAPIDNGKSKLKLELIVDPTKKPLASRILANSLSQQTPKGPKGPKGAAQAKKAKAAPAKKAGAASKPKPKPKKNAKKTIEELDQEMADYFEKKD